MTSMYNEDKLWYDRLMYTPKIKQKVIRTANDALISDLPSHTLKWIKNRRPKNTQDKVVISYQMERQLREIFNGIDVTNNGTIDLQDLKDSVKYIQKNIKNKNIFNNLNEIFIQMDEDGDGTVDFQEFTNAMTGTSKSTLDKATEFDIEQLYCLFVDYGVIKHRNYALSQINHFELEQESIRSSNNSITNNKPFHTKNNNHNNNNNNAILQEKEDHELYEMFKTLFDYKISAFKSPGQVNDDYVLKQIINNKRNKDKKLLEWFINDSHSKNYNSSGMVNINNEEYNKIIEKRKLQREKEDMEIFGDPEKQALLIKVEDQLQIEQSRIQQQKRPMTTGGLQSPNNLPRNPLPHTIIPPMDIPLQVKLEVQACARKDAIEMKEIAKLNHQINKNKLIGNRSHDANKLIPNSWDVRPSTFNIISNSNKDIKRRVSFENNNSNDINSNSNDNYSIGQFSKQSSTNNSIRSSNNSTTNNSKRSSNNSIPIAAKGLLEMKRDRRKSFNGLSCSSSGSLLITKNKIIPTDKTVTLNRKNTVKYKLCSPNKQ